MGPSNNYVTVGGGPAGGQPDISGTYVLMNSHRGKSVKALRGEGRRWFLEKKRYVIIGRFLIAFMYLDEISKKLMISGPQAPTFRQADSEIITNI